jgi:O-antigen/teichoic acid export membrane protein
VALPMILGRASVVLLSQTDVIMLGSMVGSDATGIYSATIKTAMWVSFILHSLNHAVTPTYAVLYAQKDNLKLQEVASSITLWAFVPAIITASSLAIFAQPVLNIFGSDFMVADWTLRVLIIGCLVDVSCGSCSNILVMAGYQNAYSITSILLVLMNIVLNAILIPQFGIMGAAIATSLSLIVGNVGTCVFLAQKTNINSSILSLLNFSKPVE